MKTARKRKPRRVTGSKSRKRHQRARRSQRQKHLLTRAEARRRAERHVLDRMFKGAKVRDGAKVHWFVYNVSEMLARRGVWLVYKNSDNPAALQSSCIIAVCKRTGRVLYEGSAGDEG